MGYRASVRSRVAFGARAVLLGGVVWALSATGCHQDQVPSIDVSPEHEDQGRDDLGQGGDGLSDDAPAGDDGAGALDEGPYILTFEESLAGIDSSDVPKDEQGYAQGKWVSDRREALTEAKKALITRLGLTERAVVKWYPTLTSVALWLDKGALERLPEIDGLLHVQPNLVFEQNTRSTLPFMGFEEDGQGFNADSQAGARTTVAVIDTAARYWHPEFGGCGAQGAHSPGSEGCRMTRATTHTDCAFLSQVVPDWTCIAGGGDFDIVADQTDHGTNVAGIVRRVAPGAEVWSLNVAHLAQLVGNPSVTRDWMFLTDIIDALETVNASPQGVASVNMSLGAARSENTTASCAGVLGAALRTLWEQQGIVVTISSGNDTTKNALGMPACDPHAVSVGAHYDTHNEGATVGFSGCTDTVAAGSVTCFSNSQASLNVVAPGGFVQAAGLTMSGTSQAAPHAAAVAAMIQSQALDAEGRGRLAPHALVTLMRAGAVNQSETATSQDGTQRSYTHRRLVAAGDVAFDSLHTFHDDPQGTTIPPGDEITLTINVALDEQVVEDAWLDLEVEHADISRLSVSLELGGSRHDVTGLSGANLHMLLGAQADAGLRDAFDDLDPGQDWKLNIANVSGAPATLRRGVLLLDTRAVVDDPAPEPDPQPSTPAFLGSSWDRAELSADGRQQQVLRLNFAHGAAVDEVRVMINHPWHALNERGPGGYFKITQTDCREVSDQYGNADVILNTGGCAWQVDEQGAVVFEVPFAALPSFGAAADNTVSVLWYLNQAPQGSWRRGAPEGEGFDVVIPTTTLPPDVTSFEMGLDEVNANLSDIQRITLTLNDPSLDEVRVMINHPWHAEDPLGVAGYFQITEAGCSALHAALGNDLLSFVQADCSRTEGPGDAVTFTAAFHVRPGAVSRQSLPISAMWYADGEARVTWRLLTDPGQGYAVTPATTPSVDMGRGEVTANGAQELTLRVWIPSEEPVDEVRLLVNRPQHATNGRSLDGYIRSTPEGCEALFGFAPITPVTRACRHTIRATGVWVEVPLVVDPSFGAAAEDNTLSAIWYSQGRVLSGWRRLHESGEGFDVTTVSGPASLESFALERETVAASGRDLQVFRLRLAQGTHVNQIRFMVNHPWHVENGEGPAGYVVWTPEFCAELGAGFGNEHLLLSRGYCGRRYNADNSIDIVLGFVIRPTMTPAENFSVSAIWYDHEGRSSSWRRLTAPGQGYDVVAAP